MKLLSSFIGIYILDIFFRIVAVIDESKDWTDIDFFYGSCKIFNGGYINYKPVFTIDSRYRAAFFGLPPLDLGSIYRL